MKTQQTKGWIEQAHNAIAQGQSLNDFVSHCHPDNRKKARSAYQTAQVRGILKDDSTPNKAQPDTARHSPLTEELAVANSQIENHDAILKQVRLIERANADKLAEALRKIQTLTWSDRPTKERLSLIYAGAKSALEDYDRSAQ